MADTQTFPRYPDVTVPLIGGDGNAFTLIGRVCGGLRAAGCDEATLDRFTAEATSGDYDFLLATCLRWVDIA